MGSADLRNNSSIRRAWSWLTLTWAAVRYPLGALVSWLIAITGGIATISGLMVDSVTSNSDKEVIWSWTLVVIAGMSFVAFAALSFKRVKGRALAITFRQQGHASDIIRDTRNFLRVHAIAARNGVEVPRDVLGRARIQIQDVLTTYAEVFSATTGTRCRLCIKLLRVREEIGDATPGVGDFFLYALARDALSARENKSHDEKRRDDYLDPLQDNSDFLRLWSTDVADEGSFFSADLRDDDNYQTSSLNYRHNIENNPNVTRRSDWPLWYISTIVWPIRQETNEILGISQFMHHGFLTVDSRLRGAFDRDVHEPMGRALTNALFPVIDLYTELLSLTAIAQGDT